jgi:hypothetical protein
MDSIKMDLREVRWGVMDWIGLAYDRDQRTTFVNTVINLRFAHVGKFLSSCTSGGFSITTELQEVI